MDTSKLVTGQELLEALFTEKSRPSLRWLQRLQQKRRVPFQKINRLVFFDIEKVRQSWIKQNIIKDCST